MSDCQPFRTSPVNWFYPPAEFGYNLFEMLPVKGMDTYRATNTTNGKFYIGSAADFERRKKAHLKSKENYPFQNALRKNPDAFEWEVWEDESDNPVFEQALLDMWSGKEQCYNLSPHSDRPQCNPESSSKWGKVNGPVQGARRLEEKTGIFHPDAPKTEWAKKGAKALYEGMTPEERLSKSRCANAAAQKSRTSEEKTESGRKGGEATGKQRWRCLVTNHVSTPGALTNYQRKRGISPELRERVE